MKAISRLSYRLHRYFFSSKPVIPFLFIVSSIGVLYSIKPMNVVSGYVISGVLAFILMVFVAINVGGTEDTTEEQILFLRDNRGAVYYLCRDISLILICGVYSLLLDLGPVYADLVNGHDFFLRELTLYDSLMGFLLIFAGGLSGAALGDLLNPRVVQRRKLALVSTVVLAVITIANEGIQFKFSNLGILNYILPPVMIPAKVMAKVDVIPGSSMMMIFLQTVIYCVCISAIKYRLMYRNRFN